jgi:hypothetical protein
MDKTTHYEFQYFTGTHWQSVGGQWAKCNSAEDAQKIGQGYIDSGLHRCQLVMVTTTMQTVMQWAERKEG